MANITFEWNWKSKTQTFLLVFYFEYDGESDWYSSIRTEECNGDVDERHVFSWAPSHIEQGLIGSLLSSANIVNGYKAEKKLELVDELTNRRYKLNQSTVHRLSKMIRGIE